MSVEIAKESFSPELSAEMLPLARKCWNESTIIKAESCAFYGERDFEIEPDMTTYQMLSDTGRLVLITIRDEVLQGYLLGFIYSTLHHKKIMGGIGDSIYIEPKYRAYTGVAADRFEKEMGVLGAQIIGWPVHINGPVYEVLKARGYVGDDIVMEKRLCA